MTNPIICAIDTKDIKAAKNLCSELQPHIGMVKLGLEFFTINGPSGVREISKSGTPVFLDLKFHDIPNTVAEAVKSAVNLNVTLLTIHTSGGKTMMQAAAKAAQEEAEISGNNLPLIAGVTVLTSMDENDLKEIGITTNIKEQVKRLASLAKESGLNGIVCSPHEIELVKITCGKDFRTIVPGIRPAGGEANDQKRTLTPKEAIENGADYLVIGRPITNATNKAQAAKEIAEQLGIVS